MILISSLCIWQWCRKRHSSRHSSDAAESPTTTTSRDETSSRVAITSGSGGRLSLTSVILQMIRNDDNQLVGTPRLRDDS